MPPLILIVLCFLLSRPSQAKGTTVGESQQPWEVRNLHLFTPSGRPGSSEWRTLNISIIDPNALSVGYGSNDTAVFPPTPANCSTQWTVGEVPYNKTISCDEVTYGSWTFEILEAHGDREEEERSPYYPLEDFDIRFTNAKIVTVLGKVYKEVCVGTGSFRLGENLSLVCGGSGVCSAGIKDESWPILVEQEMTPITSKSLTAMRV